MRLAVLAIGFVFLWITPAWAAESPIRSFGGPILAAEARQGAANVSLEYRYAFYVIGSADMYLKNNPCDCNAAYRDGWQTRVGLRGPTGEAELGTLVLDHPLELGRLQANTTYGLVLHVYVPASGLVNTTTLGLTYVLAVHSGSLQGNSSGAFMDTSVAITLQTLVTPGANSQSLGAWDLPTIAGPGHPIIQTGTRGPDDVPVDATPSGGVDLRLVASAVALIAILGLVLVVGRKRRGTQVAGTSLMVEPAPVVAEPQRAPQAVDAQAGTTITTEPGTVQPVAEQAPAASHPEPQPEAAAEEPIPPSTPDDAAALARALEARMKKESGKA